MFCGVDYRIYIDDDSASIQGILNIVIHSVSSLDDLDDLVLYVVLIHSGMQLYERPDSLEPADSLIMVDALLSGGMYD